MLEELLNVVTNIPTGEDQLQENVEYSRWIGARETESREDG